MKLVYTLFISLVVLFSSFNNALVFLTFKVNQKEIAQNLCVKKEIKNNTCKGQCYLAKQLKKAAEKEQKESQNAKEKQEIIYIIYNKSYSIITTNFGHNRCDFFCKPMQNPESINAEIFHPPVVYFC